MKVTGSGGVGLLVLEADPGEEILAAAVGALRASGSPFAWIQARGSLREALVESASRGGAVARLIEGGPLELASASGVWREGDASVTLSAVLSREIDRGADVVAGRLAAAVAERVELVCFLAAAPPAVVESAPRREDAVRRDADVRRDESARREDDGRREPIALGPASPSVDDDPPMPPVIEPTQHAAASVAPAQLPPKPVRRSAQDESAVYPDAGDRVTHFAFGECDVESSDGDRIRLKQDKDGRVREVSLAMLRIDPPEVDAEGRRHFRLNRKN